MSIKDQLKRGLTKAIKDFLTPMSVGQKLKISFGLEKFRYTWIQKVISSPLNIFIVTVDSRNPTSYLSPFVLDHMKFANLSRVRTQGLYFTFIDYGLTPPLNLDEFNGSINDDSLIFFRDLAGHYFLDNKMYEYQELLKDNRLLEKELKYKRIFNK